jgi:predicted CxxxxCH...CXXCH cytochrome family protein
MVFKMNFIPRSTGSFLQKTPNVILTVILQLSFICVPEWALAGQPSDNLPPRNDATGVPANSLVNYIFENGFEACLAEIVGYPDSDSDGFGDANGVPVIFCNKLPDGFVENALDCNDGTDAAFPGNTESCDGIDNDCDGEVDEGCAILTCTSCHGGVNPAPPVDTQGSSSTSATGVGAHQSHLGTSLWHNEITCEQCHVVPVDHDDPGHRDTALPAELTWGTLATLDGAIPAWNGTTCSGIYCHGSTMPLGGFIPTWTDLDGSEAACGTCHGNSTTIDTGKHSRHVISNDLECNLCHDSINEYGVGDHTAHIDGVLGVYPPLGMSASPPGGACGSKWTCSGTCHGFSHMPECW